MKDREPIDDENEFEELDLDNSEAVNFDNWDREEGRIYESIERELDVEDIVRDLPDFDPTDDLDVSDLFNDSLGG